MKRVFWSRKWQVAFWAYKTLEGSHISCSLGIMIVYVPFIDAPVIVRYCAVVKCKKKET
jgi:hypothetical protein